MTFIFFNDSSIILQNTSFDLMKLELTCIFLRLQRYQYIPNLTCNFVRTLLKQTPGIWFIFVTPQLVKKSAIYTFFHLCIIDWQWWNVPERQSNVFFFTPRANLSINYIDYTLGLDNKTNSRSIYSTSFYLEYSRSAVITFCLKAKNYDTNYNCSCAKPY